jgi:hypothetical protein
MIPLRVFLKRQRYKVAIAAVLSTLSVAVAPEHSGLAQDHIGEALSMCLAVVEGAAFLLAAGLAVKVPRRSRSPRRIRWPTVGLGAFAPAPSAPLPRAGPSLLQVFLR